MNSKGSFNHQDVEMRIKDAFHELVMTVPIDKITIKSITEKAGINRTTFYNHFQDKYEIVERIISEDVILPAVPLMENDMVNEMFILIFRNLDKDKAFYNRLSRMEGQNSFEQIVEECISRQLATYMEKHMTPEVAELFTDKYKFLSVSQLASYYARQLSFVAMAWIRKNNSDVTADYVAMIYRYLNTLSLDQLMKEIAGLDNSIDVKELKQEINHLSE